MAVQRTPFEDTGVSVERSKDQIRGVGRMSRIPGTFKSRPVVRRDLSLEGQRAEVLLLQAGAVAAQRWMVGSCSVMVALGPSPGGARWHLSIAHPERYPSWDEIKSARYGIDLLPHDAVMAQILGPVGAGEWVNVHDNCFHLYEIRDEAFR